MKSWRAPEGWQKITTIDAHTAGEPFRVVTSGFPSPDGATILEKRRFVKERYDHLRATLMLEPRGHADMYGCLVTPPVTRDADFGVLFMHNAGFSTMCGHGIIAMTTVALEAGTGCHAVSEDNFAHRYSCRAGDGSSSDRGRARQECLVSQCSFLCSRPGSGCRGAGPR